MTTEEMEAIKTEGIRQHLHTQIGERLFRCRMALENAGKSQFADLHSCAGHAEDLIKEARQLHIEYVKYAGSAGENNGR